MIVCCLDLKKGCERMCSENEKLRRALSDMRRGKYASLSGRNLRLDGM